MEKSQKTINFVEISDEDSKVEFEAGDDDISVLGGLIAFARRQNNQQLVNFCQKIEEIKVTRQGAKVFVGDDPPEEIFVELKNYFEGKGLGMIIISSNEEDDYQKLAELFGDKIEDITSFD